jgi:hypothetical protein
VWVTTLHRTIAVLGLILLCACGGGGGAATVPSAQGLANGSAGSTSWLAVLREEPSAVALSLAQPQLQYLYVDAGASNGVYPAPATFAAEFEAANPGLLSGPCARITRMSGSVMAFTDAHGVQAPSYVIFFTPVATGSCSQDVALGAEGTRSFTVTVTP